jgi:predicted DNA-binding protein (UPF0251 family)
MLSKQEIYLRECAVQMEVSEAVLFNTLGAGKKTKKSVPVRKIAPSLVKQDLPPQKK